MAESIVSFLIQKLDMLLTEEVKLLGGIHKKVANIKNELKSIEALLKDADAKAQKEGIDESTKEWINQVRQEAYHIEDVIDEYRLHVAKYCDRPGWEGFLHKIAFVLKGLKARHDIASEIRYIKESLGEIKTRRKQYKLSSAHQGASSSNAVCVLQHDPRVGSFYIEETEVVGIEASKHEIICHLVKGESKRTVISLVGMGGLGKTTLAKKVYDDREVTSFFDCHAWITVSQPYVKEELLRSIIKEFYKERNQPFLGKFNTMDYLSLINELREFLQSKRYLVAFDDVWDVGLWGDVEHALLENNKGSRILTTTRKTDVASSYKKSSLAYVRKLNPLPLEKAWKLFCRKAFQFDFNGQCPEELKELSLKIVERCGGLPLAIVVVGGLLATKEKVVREWQRLYDNLCSSIVTDSELNNVTKILSLSYYDLPYNLRSCFLYYGMFPKDCSLECQRLIQLWIAGGFVRGKQGMTVEEAGEEYLIEFIHRNLVQVIRSTYDGKPKTCQVHDLIHDVILSKSEELCFSQHVQVHSIFEGVARHLSIGNEVNNIIKSNTKFLQPRSIMVLNQVEVSKHLISTIFENFKLLNVLDFENSCINHLPAELGNLLHLQYLSLRCTNVSRLPMSIGKLHNLIYLNLENSLIDELPVDIGKFSKLRHLLSFHKETGLLKVHGKIGRLQQLEILRNIAVNKDVDFISELGRLKHIRELGIVNLEKKCGRDLCTALERMCQLQFLSLRWSGILDIQAMVISSPLHLQTLYLRGQLERLPNWISKLKNLGQLYLRSSKLKDNEALEVLQALPNLKLLALLCGYDGKQLHVAAGGFQKLDELRLGGLNELKELVIEEGALPVLNILIIINCPQLKQAPFGIQHLRGLQRLICLEMPKEFTDRLLCDEGEDCWIIKHVPFVHFNTMDLSIFRREIYNKLVEITRSDYKFVELTDSMDNA